MPSHAITSHSNDTPGNITVSASNLGQENQPVPINNLTLIESSEDINDYSDFFPSSSIPTVSERRSPGVQWIPLIRLLAIAENLNIPFVGTRSQPFEPRELVWRNAIGRGSEAIAKPFTIFNTSAVFKRFAVLVDPSDNVSKGMSQTYVHLDPRSTYQELVVLFHAALNNVPYIIRILAVDKNYSFNYFSTMIELADLGTMGDFLTAHPDTPQAQLRIFCAQVAAALDYLHSQEILHNDVKLGNILVTQNGAKLADFGHAIFNFRMQKRKKLHREDRLIGTLKWAAPEQFDLNGEEVPTFLSATSDIYSLGFVVAILASGSDFFIKYDDNSLNECKCNNLILSILPEDIMEDSTWSSKFLRRSLQLVPSKRMDSVSEALSLLSDVGY